MCVCVSVCVSVYTRAFSWWIIDLVGRFFFFACVLKRFWIPLTVTFSSLYVCIWSSVYICERVCVCLCVCVCVCVCMCVYSLGLIVPLCVGRVLASIFSLEVVWFRIYLQLLFTINFFYCLYVYMFVSVVFKIHVLFNVGLIYLWSCSFILSNVYTLVS